MITQQIKKDLSKVLEKLKISSKELFLEHPENFDHGDYSTNIAMVIFQKGKMGVLTAVDLANKIVNTWRSQGLPEYIAKIEVAKPGFINIWLQTDSLISQLGEVLKEKEKFGVISK